MSNLCKISCCIVVLSLAQIAPAQLNLTGVTGAADPSTLQQYASNGYIYFATGTGIVSRTSTNMTRWSNGPEVFPTAPAWTATAVPGALK